MRSRTRCVSVPQHKFTKHCNLRFTSYAERLGIYMLSRLLTVLALLIVVNSPACAERDPINIDFMGTDEEFSAAQEAADMWNNTCHRDLVHLFRGSGHGISTSGLNGDAGGEVGNKHLGVTHCNCGNASWVVYQKDSKYSLVEILAHEFGHALLSCSNADHNTGAVMSAQINVALVDKEGHLTTDAITQEQCDNALR